MEAMQINLILPQPSAHIVGALDLLSCLCVSSLSPESYLVSLCGQRLALCNTSQLQEEVCSA